MPLQLVRSDSNHVLFDACRARFLDELGGRTGPGDFPSHLWVVHRTQRDLILEEAAARGLPGWLDPPLSFFSQLPERFQLAGRPVGLLSSRLLVARLAAAHARRLGFVPGIGRAGPARGHMLDGLFSELLPEGVEPAALREALAALGGDGFALDRAAWIDSTYEAYLETLAADGRYDPRSTHALLAERVREGGLREAIGGAGRLHVYGLTSLRGRRTLFRSLRAQRAVDVIVYLPAPPAAGAPDEWERLAGHAGERLRGAPPSVSVQPAPDAVREADWVVSEIKRSLLEEDLSPHDVAVVARTGREDTRRIHAALLRAGVPATSRIRIPLAEIPALRAILTLLRAATLDWPYDAFRAAATNPYLGLRLDPRVLDLVAVRRQPDGLQAWAEDLAHLAGIADRGAARDDRGVKQNLDRRGLTGAHLRAQATRIEQLRDRLQSLSRDRTEAEWIAWTLGALAGQIGPLRVVASTPPDGQWDIVRTDQRGIVHLEELLRELRALIDRPREMSVGEWHESLERLLEANELALSTPLTRGVQVLEAHQAATTPFRRTFVIHANDGEFPRRRRVTGIFSEDERTRLAASGLPLADADTARAREGVLFGAVAAGADVTVSYRSVDVDGAPRLPSHLVPAHDLSVSIPRTAAGEPGRQPPTRPSDVLVSDLARLLRLRRAGDPTPIPTPDPARLRSALINGLAEEWRTGRLDGLGGTEAGLFDPARAAEDPGPDTSSSIHSEAARRLFATERPLSSRAGPWSGRIREPEVLKALRHRYPPDRAWSASQLELYGRRPFDFLVGRVLRLELDEVAEAEISRRTRGALAHTILERFYSEQMSAGREDFGPDARDAFEAVFDACCTGFERDADEWLGQPHVWAATRTELWHTLTAFLEWEFDAGRPGTPLAVEHVFGFGDQPPVDLGGPDARGTPASLRLRGRIDRIDRTAGGGLRVVDYKGGTSAPGKKEYLDGAAFQCALYAAVANELGLGSVSESLYRPLKARGNRTILRPGDLDLALRLARSIPERVRSGWFEPVQAASCEIKDWQLGREVVRSVAVVVGTHRYETDPA